MIKEEDPLYNNLSDKVNDLYGLFYAGTMFVSPLIGSYINGIVGASVLCDYTAFINFGFGIIFLIFNCGCPVFLENKEFNEIYDTLRSE